MAYDANRGTVKWIGRYNGPINSSYVAEALAISPDGKKVFVTGWGYGDGTSADFLTMAYKH